MLYDPVAGELKIVLGILPKRFSVKPVMCHAGGIPDPSFVAALVPGTPCRKKRRAARVRKGS